MNSRRTWLITGAASGLGRELSTQLARRGDKLVLWDRDAERLERSASLLGPAVVHSEVVDVVNPDATRAAAERATDAASRISRVVHCAGILRAGPALGMSRDGLTGPIMEVNFLGSVHVARALTPALIENGKPHDRSRSWSCSAASRRCAASPRSPPTPPANMPCSASPRRSTTSWTANRSTYASSVLPRSTRRWCATCRRCRPSTGSHGRNRWRRWRAT